MPFFALAWSAITSRLAGPIAIAAALGLLWWGVSERLHIYGLNHDIETLARSLSSANQTIDMLRRDNATLAGNARQLQDALDAQNAAVNALKAESDKRSADANAALKQLAAARTMSKTLADQIVMRLPPPGVDVCVAALDAARNPDQ